MKDCPSYFWIEIALFKFSLTWNSRAVKVQKWRKVKLRSSTKRLCEPELQSRQNSALLALIKKSLGTRGR